MMEEPRPSAVDLRGFRPRSRRRARVAAGAAMVAIAVVGNVAVYSSLDDSAEVLQFTTNVHAGDVIGPGDVRAVAVDADLAATDLIPAARLDAVIGRYARTFIPARALASTVLVRSSPVVSPGAAVVAIEPAGGRLPRGIVERSRVWLVSEDLAGVIDARVVALDREVGDGVVSVEVAEYDAPAVAAAERVHLVLLDPGVDPASVEVGGNGDR